jgi:hypothetical protein
MAPGLEEGHLLCTGLQTGEEDPEAVPSPGSEDLEIPELL